MFSCFGILSCSELCIFLCRLVLFVSTLAKWLAGKTYYRYIFCVKLFPLQRPHWRVIYCSGLLYVLPTRDVVSFLINFTFLTTTYFSKAQYSLFVLKFPLNPYQSICSPCGAWYWLNIPTSFTYQVSVNQSVSGLSNIDYFKVHWSANNRKITGTARSSVAAGMNRVS